MKDSVIVCLINAGSIIFGWDALDLPYNPPLKISNNENGFTDILAKIDLNSLRSGFKTNSMPHFLVDFYNLDGSPLYCCPRNLLKSVIKSLSVIDLHPKCGIEFEFFNFKETQTTLAQKKGVNLTPLTTGMFGYSLTRPQQNSQYFTDIYDECLHYGIEIECLHTETGPGVYEVALSYTDALRLADNAHLFKTVVKQIGIKNGIVPCFMAKPYNDLPGCSGHIHVSLANLIEKNVFTNSTGSGIDSLSKTMIHFLAGVLAGLPSLMGCFI